MATFNNALKTRAFRPSAADNSSFCTSMINRAITAIKPSEAANAVFERDATVLVVTVEIIWFYNTPIKYTLARLAKACQRPGNDGVRPGISPKVPKIGYPEMNDPAGLYRPG
jgi:hypothetical protein